MDHTTDVRRGKLRLYEAWGFPEVWVEVPDRPAPSRPRGRRPGLTIHRLEGGAYRESAVSPAFPGWRATAIHEAINEVEPSGWTHARLEHLGRTLGARDGTGPDDDPLLRSLRGESREEGRREGRAEGPNPSSRHIRRAPPMQRETTLAAAPRARALAEARVEGIAFAGLSSGAEARARTPRTTPSSTPRSCPMKSAFRLLAAAVVSLAAAVAQAADFKPAVVYDMGGKFDKSFNEGVYNGVKRFTEETGIEVAEFEVTNEAQRQRAMERLVQRGATVLLGVGFGQADALSAVAEANPDVRFGIIDVFWLDQPNLRQYSFKEHEGSYLVGVAAAMKSASGTVGFIGGMDVPLIRKFACGYVQGVKSVGGDVRILQNMTGTTPAAWNDPVKGGELAQSQIDRGADVIYHAAGGTGIGVIQTTADAGRFAIGVDANQNYLAPGKVLTSMVKRVDVAAYQHFMDAYEGRFSAGVVQLGLAEGGVDWAVDEHNRDLVSGEIEAAVAAAKKGIISGAITVHNYEDDQSCPF